MYKKIKQALAYTLICASMLTSCKQKENVNENINRNKAYQEKKVEAVQANKQYNKLEQRICDDCKEKARAKQKVSYQVDKLDDLIDKENDRDMKLIYEVIKEEREEDKKDFSKYSLPLKTNKAYSKDLNDAIKSVNQTYARKLKIDKTIDYIVDSESKEDDKQLDKILSYRVLTKKELLSDLKNYDRAIVLEKAINLGKKGKKMVSKFNNLSDSVDETIKSMYEDSVIKQKEDKKEEEDLDWIERARKDAK